MYEQNKEKWKKERFDYLMDKKADIEYQIAQLVDYPYADIQQSIRGGKSAFDLDMLAFNRYSNGEYTLQDTIKSFMFHHGISEARRTFEDAEFEGWLGSLGYEKSEAPAEG